MLDVKVLAAMPINDAERRANVAVLTEGVKGLTCICVEGFTRLRSALLNETATDLRDYYPRRLEVYSDGSFNLVLESRYNTDTQLVIRNRIPKEAETLT